MNTEFAAKLRCFFDHFSTTIKNKDLGNEKQNGTALINE